MGYRIRMVAVIFILSIAIMVMGCTSKTSSISFNYIKIPDEMIVITKNHIDEVNRIHQRIDELRNSEKNEDREEIDRLINRINEIGQGIALKDETIIHRLTHEIAEAHGKKFTKQKSDVAFSMAFIYHDLKEVTNEKDFIKQGQEGYIQGIVILQDRTAVVPWFKSEMKSIGEMETYTMKISEETFKLLTEFTDKAQ